MQRADRQPMKRKTGMKPALMHGSVQGSKSDIDRKNDLVLKESWRCYGAKANIKSTQVAEDEAPPRRYKSRSRRLRFRD
jgi:hypothetical protein